MADFIFNVGKGKMREYHDRVANNDPANSALILVVINTATADATLLDLDDLAAVLADGGTAEVTNTNYARITLTDADLTASSADDANDRVDLDFSDQSWSSVAAGDNWTDILLCYDSDTGSGTDANIIPIACYDFVVTPNGGNITAQVNAQGYYTV